jgi:hypothetical protein
MVLNSVGSADAAAPKKIKIGKTEYYAGDLLSMASRMTKVTRNPAVKIALTAINLCKGNGVNAFGFASLSGKSGGVVAWAPADLSGCIGTSGGGPGGEIFSPCFEGYRTPENQDPTGVSGGRTSGRSFVLIAGTSTQTCADLSTQAPGGVWGTTGLPVPGLPAQSVVVVKCQRMSGNVLLDLVAPYSNSLPAPKNTYWIDDSFVWTEYVQAIDGVPTC